MYKYTFIGFTLGVFPTLAWAQQSPTPIPTPQVPPKPYDWAKSVAPQSMLRRLQITSNLEAQNWYKYEGVLPDAYKKKVIDPETNAVQWVPDPDIARNAGLPQDPPDHTWRLMHKRKVNREMTIDTTAEYVMHPDQETIDTRNSTLPPEQWNDYGGKGNWFGGITLTADQNIFDDAYPQCIWTHSGGTWKKINYNYQTDNIGGEITNEPHVISSEQVFQFPKVQLYSYQLPIPLTYGRFVYNIDPLDYRWRYHVEGLHLSASMPGATGSAPPVRLPSSEFGVSVQRLDANGEATGGVYNAPKYTVNWHRPDENYRPKPMSPRTKVVLDTAPKGEPSDFISHPFTLPVNTEKVLTLKDAAGYISKSLWLVGSTYGMLTPTTGIAGRILSFATAVTGAVPPLISSEPSKVTISGTASYNNFRDDLNKYFENSTADSAPRFLDNEGNNLDTLFLIDVWAENDAHSDGNANIYWSKTVSSSKGSWQVQVSASQFVALRDWQVERYNANGYAGEQLDEEQVKDVGFQDRVWYWQPTTPPNP